MAITDKDWIPENHYGITRKRAIELGEDAEYPRISAAVFHFDKLTPEEQQTVIKHKKEELVEALEDRKRVYAESKKSAQTSRALHIDSRSMNPFPDKKKRVKERIEMLQKSVDRLTDSAKTAKPKQKPLRDMTKTELKKLRVILHILPDGTMEIKEKGTDSLERRVASWNPPNRPDMTEHSRVGGYIMNENVADNAKKWLDMVAEQYDLDMDEIVAESWRGGGMKHKESPYSSVTNTFTGKVKTVGGSDITKTSKEPWQMTTAELKPLVDKGLVEQWQVTLGQIEAYARRKIPGVPVSEGAIKATLLRHKQSVEEAIAEGKSVPAEVLKDYSDLKKQAKTTRLKPNKSSEMYRQGYSNAAIRFGYIPDFNTEQDRVDFEAGMKAGYAKRDKLATGQKSDAMPASQLQAIEDSRSPRSRESDERLSNADTIELDDPRVDIWERDPGRMDVSGIDTPRKGKGSGKGKKVARKVRKDSGRRVGKLETQLGGLRGKR